MLEPSESDPIAEQVVFEIFYGIEKCCHIPGRSINLRSTILTPEFLASSLISAGVRGMLLTSFIVVVILILDAEKTIGGEGMISPESL
jgi:hypothetical protein